MGSSIVLLVTVVLLLNSAVGLCGCYKRIFSFGDSIIDTGNFAHITGNDPSAIKELPYGMTYFNHPTGRISDGRVIVDFYAQALQLPLIPPNLPEQDSGLFPTGANFAVFGSTALPSSYYRRWNHSVSTPSHLGEQIDWFKGMLQRIAPGDGDKRQLLGESLIVLGEIGGNDYNFWFGARKPREQAYQFIPDVVACIGSFAQDLIGLGAKTIVIPNNFPIGCVPSYLTGYQSDNPEDYDENWCLRWYNDFSARHNQALLDEVHRLTARNPGAKLIYADYYGAAMEFVKSPGRFGIVDPLVACCGGGGRYHTDKGCDKMARVWGSPGSFASWDGMHMTEKAYQVISQGVLDGPFADLPLLRSC
ncbi:GDSL esterase/lipase At1g28600-like [Phragmites australis]|uniref:GDSL esterase/lipase At1g28600-like n=1 Tax=Phragmites australis TaxID=29695 RepID=UPI002D765664|nr:GDSL esterase/lipase At1g28600-like [Phragmites australis]